MRLFLMIAFPLLLAACASSEDSAFHGIDLA